MFTSNIKGIILFYTFLMVLVMIWYRINSSEHIRVFHIYNESNNACEKVIVRTGICYEETKSILPRDTLEISIDLNTCFSDCKGYCKGVFEITTICGNDTTRKSNFGYFDLSYPDSKSTHFDVRIKSNSIFIKEYFKE